LLDAVKTILTSEATYFLVKVKGLANQEGIAFISFPPEMGAKICNGETGPSDVNVLLNTEVYNVFLYPNYTPFQYGLTLYGLEDVLVIRDVHAKKFLKEALNLESANWQDYVKLYERLEKELTEEIKNRKS